MKNLKKLEISNENYPENWEFNYLDSLFMNTKKSFFFGFFVLQINCVLNFKSTYKAYTLYIKIIYANPKKRQAEQQQQKTLLKWNGKHVRDR